MPHQDREGVSLSLSAATVVAVGGAVFLPVAVLGTGFYLDDWFALRNAELDGWLASAGTDQWYARPVAAAVYAVTFGLLGEVPLAHFGLAAVLMVLSALVLLVLARRFAPAPVASVLASLWLLLPNHTSLEMWPSALNIALALLLLLVGVERLLGKASAVDVGLACLAFAVSVLAYEATAPLAIVVAVVAGRRNRARFWSVAVPPVVTVGACLTWMAIHWHPAKQGIDQDLDPARVFPAHFGNGVLGPSVLASTIGIAVLAASAAAAYLAIRRDWRSGIPTAVRWVAIGWSIVLLGTAPFLRYHYEPLGLGDRVTVVSGVGGAIVFTGLIWWGTCRSKLVGSMALGLLVVGAVCQRVDMVESYVEAAEDGRQVLDHVEARWPEPPSEEIVFGPQPVVRNNITPYFEMDWPLQRLYGSSEVRGRMTFDLESFEQTPVQDRVDLREVAGEHG